MSTPTPTPGPWIADGYDLRQKNGRMIAYFGPHHTPADEYPLSCRLQDEANAQWVAAARNELAAAKGECERLKFSTEGHLLKTIQQQAELARLRAQNDQFSDNLSAVGKAYNAEKDRAEKAETELACEKENRNHLIEKGAKLETELTAACSLQTLACRKLDAAEIELATERAIVSRIWVQLGSPTYAELNGRSIYDLIDEMKTELARLRAELERADVLYQRSCEVEHKLRAEVERLLIIEQQFKQSPMWDTLAIVQTRNNWKDRAERAEVERDALAADKARLDWLSVSDAWFDYPATGAFTPDTMRAAIDAAMKGTT